MGDVDETAKLWKVNRTIHELVRDRVCTLFLNLWPNVAHTCSFQGFLVSDEEIHMDLQRFRDLYANNSGTVE